MTNSNRQTTVGISNTFGILFGVMLTSLDVRYTLGILFGEVTSATVGVRYTLDIMFGEVNFTTIVIKYKPGIEFDDVNTTTVGVSIGVPCPGAVGDGVGFSAMKSDVYLNTVIVTL